MTLVHLLSLWLLIGGHEAPKSTAWCQEWITMVDPGENELEPPYSMADSRGHIIIVSSLPATFHCQAWSKDRRVTRDFILIYDEETQSISIDLRGNKPK